MLCGVVWCGVGTGNDDGIRSDESCPTEAPYFGLQDSQTTEGVRIKSDCDDRAEGVVQSKHETSIRPSILKNVAHARACTIKRLRKKNSMTAARATHQTPCCTFRTEIGKGKSFMLCC